MNRIIAGLCAVLVLSACVEDNPKQNMGTLVGAGLGALAGAQIGHGKGQLAATAIGTLIGAGIGNSIGASLDRADRLALENAQYAALESNRSGTPATWENPDSGHSGSVTPAPAVRGKDGRYCREFTQKITVGEKTKEAYGKACRQPDGSWQIMTG